MTRPLVSEATERIYGRLPGAYRDADEVLGDGAGGYPFLRYISSIFDRLGEVTSLADRIDFDSTNRVDSSDLVNPDTADASWLPWLAQLVGVRLVPGMSVALQRQAIRSASSGWRSGTKPAIAAAAATALTGLRSVQVFDHYQDDPWQVEVRTKATETPDPNAVLAAIEALGAKPAGILLVATSYSASWNQISAAWPTWTALESAGSWDVIESTDLGGVGDDFEDDFTGDFE